MYPKKLKKYSWGNMIQPTQSVEQIKFNPYISTQPGSNLRLDSKTDIGSGPVNSGNGGNSTLSQAGGAAANVLASYYGSIVDKSIKKDPSQAPLSSEDPMNKRIDATGTAIAGYFGPWYAALAQIGTATGKAVRGNEQDADKNRIGNLLSPFNQFKDNRNAGDWVQSFLTPGQSAIDKGNRMSRKALEYKNQQIRNMETQSQEFLKNYPTFGDTETAKYGMRIPKFGRTPNYFRGLKTMAYGGYSKKWNPSEYPTNWAQGGELPQVTDNSDQQQIASDMNVYKGATHAQGGIDLDTNKDGRPDIEVENNEVIKDDMVLSDRMTPSDVVKEHLRQLGIYKQEDDTFASYAERLGKKKGEWEMKLNSHLLGEANTAKRMVSKFDNAVDMLFQDQQSQKPVEAAKTKYPTGGELPTGWEFVNDTPSSRPGYRTKSFINRGALPEPNYTGQITREDFIKNTGAFTRKDLDFPLNQARTAFESSPNVRSVTLGRERQSVEGAINPSYPLTSRTEDYRDLDYGVSPHTFNIKGVSPFTNTTIPTFRSPDNTIVPRTNFFSQDNESLAKLNNMELPKKGQSYVSTYAKGGHWIQGAINSAHKGYCTPMTKATCTGRRRALALTFKKHHGFHKKGYGGYIDRINVDMYNPQGIGNKAMADGGNWKDFLGDNTGELATLAGTIGNQVAIGKLKTNYQPELAPVPYNTYTDRSDYITNQGQAQYRALTYGLNSGSQQDNQGLRSNMYAKTLGSTNEQLDRETQRRDAYQQHYQQMLQYNNFFNTQQKNYGKQLTMDNQNQKVALTQANLNNSIQSLIGNKTQKDAQRLDFMKAKLYASMGEKGVTDRTMGISTDEELRKYYGMSREEIKALRKRLTNIGNTKQTNDVDTNNYILDSQS